MINDLTKSKIRVAGERTKGSIFTTFHEETILESQKSKPSRTYLFRKRQSWRFRRRLDLDGTWCQNQLKAVDTTSKIKAEPSKQKVGYFGLCANAPLRRTILWCGNSHLVNTLPRKKTEDLCSKASTTPDLSIRLNDRAVAGSRGWICNPS